MCPPSPRIQFGAKHPPLPLEHDALPSDPALFRQGIGMSWPRRSLTGRSQNFKYLNARVFAIKRLFSSILSSSMPSLLDLERIVSSGIYGSPRRPSMGGFAMLIPFLTRFVPLRPILRRVPCLSSPRGEYRPFASERHLPYRPNLHSHFLITWILGFLLPPGTPSPSFSVFIPNINFSS